jgi:small multidrug resistance family-3 protein
LNLITTTALFVATALAEIIGCDRPWLWMKDRAPAWVLLPAAVSLVAFVWLFTLQPTAAGRVMAVQAASYKETGHRPACLYLEP